MGGKTKSAKRLTENECWIKFGAHDYQEFIDPQSGGFVECSRRGKQVDCEESEDW